MDKHRAPQAVSLLIGPEGGFTEEEEDLATDKV
jgi:16S rRNA U1498 N3-methylase RsmE